MAFLNARSKVSLTCVVHIDMCGPIKLVNRFSKFGICNDVNRREKMEPLNLTMRDFI